MESMVLLEEESRIPASKVSFTGDLNLLQRTPLWYRGIDRRFATPVINGSSLNAEEFTISNILGKYFSRNVTTRDHLFKLLEPKYSIWQPSPIGISEFNLEVTVNYVTESIQYYAGFWELIKWGWVQYVSILLVFIFVFGRIRALVFGNRLLMTVPEKVRYYG